MQVVERVRDLLQITKDDRIGETRVAALSKQGREIGALDPVHHQVVAVAFKEVIAYNGEPGMRFEIEQHTRLFEQELAILGSGNFSDLDRDRPVVKMVERLDDFP